MVPSVHRIRQAYEPYHFEQAWRWTQARPHLYPATGGRETLADYLARARRKEQNDFGVFVDDALHSLITVEMEGEGEFNFHLTSQPKPDFNVIRAAVFHVGERLFLDLDAQEICTLIPRLFARNRRLALACGMRFIERVAVDDTPYDIFAISRAEYLKQYGQ